MRPSPRSATEAVRGLRRILLPILLLFLHASGAAAQEGVSTDGTIVEQAPCPPDTTTYEQYAERVRTSYAREVEAAKQAAEAAQPAPPPAAVRMSPEDRQRALEIRQRADALVTLTDPAEAAARLAEVRLAFAEFQADVEVEPALIDSFEAASEAVREAQAPPDAVPRLR